VTDVEPVSSRFLPRLAMCRTLLAVAALLSAAPLAAAERRPDIVLILADDLGFSDLGCYGSEIHTPNLDRLASAGLRFTQFYNCARCCPTRAALLTGLYPHQAGVGHMVADLGRPAYRGRLDARCITAAEVLRAAGYRTLMSGKWHVTPVARPKDNWPTHRGFDRFYGLIGSVRSYYDPPTLTREDQPIRARGKDYYLTDAITEQAVAYLDEYGKKPEPIFLYVAYTAPHWPLHARPADIARHRAVYQAGWDELRKRRHERMKAMGLVERPWPLTPRDADAPAWKDVRDREWHIERMAVYAAMVETLDRGVGRIVDRLRQQGRLDNTLLLFLSDNGGCAEEILAGWRGKLFPLKTRDGRPTKVGNDPAVKPGPDDVFQSYGLPWANASNTPFRRYKHWVHEGGIATPLIAHWPRVITRPGLTHQPGHVIDLLPTFMDVARAEFPKKRAGLDVLPLEGKSLAPILRGRQRAGHAALFWEHEGNRAVRAGKWKLVAPYRGSWELYDLEADRTEQTDLAAKHPDKVKELAAAYERWAKRCGVVPWAEIAAKVKP
jgi:arylsulfatase